MAGRFSPGGCSPRDDLQFFRVMLAAIPQCLNLAYTGISSIIEEFITLPVI